MSVELGFPWRGTPPFAMGGPGGEVVSHDDPVFTLLSHERDGIVSTFPNILLSSKPDVIVGTKSYNLIA